MPQGDPGGGIAPEPLVVGAPVAQGARHPRDGVGELLAAEGARGVEDPGYSAHGAGRSVSQAGSQCSGTITRPPARLSWSLTAEGSPGSPAGAGERARSARTLS